MERRQTPKKAAITEELKKMHTHPTALELKDALDADGMHISRATVFRVLNDLADEGSIHRVEIEGSDVRYDGNTAPHYHFHCKVCRRTMDIDLPYETVLDSSLASEGYRVDRHTTEFYGICPACRKRALKK